jgi:hypothetical protein
MRVMVTPLVIEEGPSGDDPPLLQPARMPAAARMPKAYLDISEIFIESFAPFPFMKGTVSIELLL